MKGTNKQQQRAERANINYKAKFTGETLVRPITFNPNGEQIKTIKSLPETFDVTDPTYTRNVYLYENDEKVEKEFTVLSLMCSYNPNELLGVENQYSDEMFVNYEIYISPEQVKGKDKKDSDGNIIPNSAKYQLIDDHNQTAWVVIKPKQKIADAIKAAKEDSTTSPYDSVHKIDPKTARIACVGEVALYQLLFNMSNFDEHKPDKEQYLNEFVISDKPTESFKNLCAGNFEELNKFCKFSAENDDYGDFFFPNGEQNMIGLLLSVQVNKDGTTLYQSCYRTETERNIYINCTFRPISRLYDLKDSPLGKNTRLPKELIKHLTDKKYPWRGEFGGTLAFKEMTLDMIKENESLVTEGADDDDDGFPF